MSEENTDLTADRLAFSRVGVARRDFVFVTAHPDDDAGDEDGDPTADPSATYVLQYESGEWGYIDLAWAGPLITVRHSPLRVDIIGVEGEVLSGDGERFSEAHIDRSPRGPAAIGWLRGARDINGILFAVGMGRQAYRCDGGRWKRIDAGLRDPGAGAIGLEAVDGRSPSDVYTVGLNGEAFRYNGVVFQKLDSPTNLALRNVRCVGDETVFICGSGGILLRGTGDDFEPIFHESTEENLYSLEWFGEHLYVASLSHVYRLEGERLIPVDLGVPTSTAGHLHAADGVLWSCGAKHLAFTTNGKTWTPITVKI